VTAKRTFSEELRRAIRRSGKTRYRISKETGISEAVLCKFMKAEHGMLLPSIDKLYVNLGLRLTTEGEAKANRPTKKGR
jgi:hypothetical protein